MRREIGGYPEFERYHLPMLHDTAIALNSGSACLAYLLRAKKIRKLCIPYYLCYCVRDICKREGTAVRYYRIQENFCPEAGVELGEDEWLYVVNYFGQLTDAFLEKLVSHYKRVIVDQTHGYFRKPIAKADNIYTCRKFFGVSDGGFLYTDAEMDTTLPLDESFERMRFLMGRYERTASEFYREFSENEEMLSQQPVKRMSRLTENLLHGIDYERIKRVRTENFQYLHEKLKKKNLLSVRAIEGAYAYPLLLNNGAEIRQKMIKEKVYISLLWPNVLEDVEKDCLEYRLAENILPLPVDQRYQVQDMQEIVELLDIWT